MTHLVDIRIDAKAMFLWARSIGIGTSDVGYVVHSLICAAYGQFRMQPFRHFEEGASIRVLGYCAVPSTQLADERQAVAEPAVSIAITSELSKEMPVDWREGSTYSFTLRMAPIVQYEGRQMDAYLRAPEGSSRDEVYLEWLERRISEAVDIVDARMESFSLESVARRSAAANENGRRPLGKRFTIPSVIFSGTVAVKNSAKFGEMIAKGVGRHAAFGYGAVLLRPSKPTISLEA